MARKTKVEEKEEEEEEEEVYHVEVITKARVSEDGDWEYLVKWAGYGSDADSWEPSENVKQCNRLLTSFWKHIGTDDEDYAIGYEIAAQEDWINKEKRYFAETFVKSSKRKAKKEMEQKETEQKERQERRKSKTTTPRRSVSTEDDANSSSDQPSKKKRPVHKPLPADTESESESDVPLRRQSKDSHAVAPLKEIAKASPHLSRHESMSTTGGARGAPVIAPPKVTPLRTHQDQKSNPLVKPMDLHSKSLEAGSLLSTKQRIAAGIPPPPSGPKPLQTAPKKSLSSLSFKKNTQSAPITIQAKDASARTSGAAVAPLVSSATQQTGAMDDVPKVASPQPMDVSEPTDIFTVSEDVGTFDGSGMLAPPFPSKTQEQIDAEMFLKTVDIPELSAPLEPADLPDKTDIQLSGPKASLTMPKIPKKWKWLGDLFITVSTGKTELLCSVTITDPSGQSNSSYINLLLSSLDSLRISRLFPIMDLSPIIRSCGKPQYFGRLDATLASDEELVKGFNVHLINEAFAAAIPLSLGGNDVAILLVIPGAHKGLAKVLQIPEQIVEGASLLVALLPFSLSATMAIKATGWSTLQAGLHPLASNLHNVKITPEVSQDAILSQAITLLGFPRALLDLLNSTSNSRTYCLWPLPSQLSLGLDEALLQIILKSTKATLAKVEEDVRVIFISNRHLEMLHTLPSIVLKRVNFPEIQFWTYGHCVNISSDNWRLKEVFPLGGVITFTAAAVAEDPVGCHHLMSQVIEHPLWDCYLTPKVLAAIYISYGGDSSLMSEKTCLDPILRLIDLGMVSLMKVPGQDHSEQEGWIAQAVDQSSYTGHELLAFHVSALNSHPATTSMTAEQLFAATTTEVASNLMKAQTHPTFMESYRRFVVIKSPAEVITTGSDGLEWCSLSSFHFKDDYF